MLRARFHLPAAKLKAPLNGFGESWPVLFFRDESVDDKRKRGLALNMRGVDTGEVQDLTLFPDTIISAFDEFLYFEHQVLTLLQRDGAKN